MGLLRNLTPKLYVEIGDGKLTFQKIGSDKVVEVISYCLVDSEGFFYEIAGPLQNTGTSKWPENLIRENPFANERLLIDNTYYASQILSHLFLKHFFKSNGFFRLGFVRPTVIVKINRKFKEGVTQSEYETMRQVMEKAGVLEVYFWKRSTPAHDLFHNWKLLLESLKEQQK